ncbi:MAG: carbohydrate ABC transporter permease [Proteobacteria bacterium]|nr:carbohydrate ABC transporter permease [Pseudomonadota bacterium]
MRKKLFLKPGAIAAHGVLLLYTLIAIFPIWLILINSLKKRRAIFKDPLKVPDNESFSLIGYEKVLSNSEIFLNLNNSLTVTLVTLFLVLMGGSMAAFYLSEYKFKGNTILGLYLAIGIMIPIRLGTVSIIKLMVSLNLANTLTSLILVYTAQGLPLAIFIISEFMSQIPSDLKDAGRIDGLNEYSIFFRIVLPLIKPIVATVAVFTMIPIWNDLWFPLVLANSGGTQTLTLGAQQFIGQYVTDWNSVLASLSMAMFPVLILYILFSRQLISGITSGAVK